MGAMKIYVASSSKHIARARYIMKTLNTYGFSITLDWTVNFEPNAPSCHPSVYAQRDADAIQEAQALVFVDNETTSPGAWWEVGYAYAQGKPIFALVLPWAMGSKVFLFMPNVRLFDSIDSLLRGLHHWRSEYVAETLGVEIVGPSAH